jgi:hypothetical protein
MKVRILVALLLGFLFIFPSCAQSQPDKGFDRSSGGGRRSGDLRVLQLEMDPDPVREGQWVRFQAVISNLSSHLGRVSLFVKDKDEVVAAVEDVSLRPGDNRIVFPQTRYRFQRQDSCFTVEVDIERSRRPVDLAKEFCARKTYQGWSMRALRVGPLFIEDLGMVPDPAQPGQEVRFRAKIRNDGNPIRANIRIQDRDEVVAQLDDASLNHGTFDYWFLQTPHKFQRLDHCFTVVVDVERTPHRVDAAREFCAKPYGWSLRP